METASASGPHPADLPTETQSIAVDLSGVEVEQHSPETPRVFDAREAFDIDAVEVLRAQQTEAYDQARLAYIEAGDDETTASHKAQAAVAETIDAYLKGHGLTAENDDYLKYKGGLLSVSITEVPESEWYAKFTDETETTLGQSGEDKTRTTYQKLTNEPYYKVHTTEATPGAAEAPAGLLTDEEAALEASRQHAEAIDVEKAKLVALRDQLAALSAKRQGRLGGGRNDEYEQIEAMYNLQIATVGKLELAEVLAASDRTEVEKQGDIGTYFLKEQNRLREASLAKLKGTTTSRLIEALTKGTRTERILKGIGVGVAAGAVGFAAATVLGTAAGLVAVGAGVSAAAIGAGRFARGFAIGDAYGGRGMKEVATAEQVAPDTATDVPENLEQYFNRTQAQYAKVFEADINEEQRKRRRSVVIGIGAIAVGGLLGVAAHTAADFVVGGVGTPDVDATPVPDPEVPSPEPTVPDGGDFDGNGIPDDQPGGIAEPTPEPEPTPDSGPVGPEAIVADPDFIIEDGEGGIHFFQDLGLTEADWYSVDQELLTNFPDDFYPMPGGQVGLAHPGQLSLEAQEFIKLRFGVS